MAKRDSVMMGFMTRLLPIWKSRWFRLTVGLAALACLGVKTQLIAHLREGHVGFRAPYAILGVCLGVVIMIVRAWRWNIILADIGKPLPMWRLLRAYCAAFFLGLISPGRIGEVARIWLARDAVPSLPSAAASVVFDRIFDVVPALVITIAFGASVAFGGSSHGIFWIRSGLALLTLAGMGLLCFPHKLRSYIERVTQRTLRRFRLEDGANVVESKSLSRRALLAAFAVSVLSQLFVLMQAWLFCEAVSATGINPLETFAVLTMATVVAALPLSVGGIGTREVAVASALSSLGLSATQAMSFSILTLANFMIVASVTMLAFISRPEGIPSFRKAQPSMASRGRTGFGSLDIGIPDEEAVR
jgi:uncharacterized protein (TIRG00374 family)